MAGNFQERDRAFGQFAVDADADAGLEVGVEIVGLGHGQRQGAVGEMDFARYGIHLGRITLEAAFAGDGLGDGHGDHGRNVALAAGDNPFRVEAGQRQAARIVKRGQQVKAAKGQAGELFFLHHEFQGAIDAVGAGDGGAYLPFHAFPDWDLLPLTDIRVANGLVGFHQALHRDIDHVDAQPVMDGLPVAAAGDEPVGGKPDDTESLTMEGLEGVDGFLQHGDAVVDVFVAAMENFTAKTLPVEIAQDFQRSGERVALAGGQQVEGTVLPELPGNGLEKALRAAGADIDQVESFLAVFGKIGAAIGVLNVQAVEEVPGLAVDALGIVEGGGEGVDGNHGVMGIAELKLQNVITYGWEIV